MGHHCYQMGIEALLKALPVNAINGLLGYVGGLFMEP
jgi:hypothetical protein